MIMDHAGEPEVRCVACGDRSVDHPTFKHWLWNWLAASEAFVRFHLGRVL